MRRCLIIRKRLAMQRRYRERVLRRLQLQLANQSLLSGVIVQIRAELLATTTNY